MVVREKLPDYLIKLLKAPYDWNWKKNKQRKRYKNYFNYRKLYRILFKAVKKKSKYRPSIENFYKKRKYQENFIKVKIKSLPSLITKKHLYSKFVAINEEKELF